MSNNLNKQRKMAKGNPFIGMARGSAGDFTFYRSFGEQVFRARNRHPANPQTDLQLLQRVIMLTTQRAYSLLSPLADHSFAGRKPGTMSQARFTELNNAMLRNGLAQTIEDIITGEDTGWPTMANYNGKSSVFPAMMPFVLSEGTIAPVSYQWHEGFSCLPTGALALTSDTSYQELVDALGVAPGDQLTFVQLVCDDTKPESYFTGIKFARVILAPGFNISMDMDVNIFATSANGALIIDPEHANPRNMGSVFFSDHSVGTDLHSLAFSFVDSKAAEASNVADAPAGCAVIVSRQSGDVWQRSNSSIAMRAYTIGTGNLKNDHGTAYLGDAMESFRTSSAGSTRYLNQANIL